MARAVRPSAHARAPRRASLRSTAPYRGRTGCRTDRPHALRTAAGGGSHWSRRSMAKASRVSGTTVGRVWRAFGLQPHRSETFKPSTDPLFAEKVRDIVGLYLAPPARALVLCVNEKSQVQALDRTQPLLPLRPGQAERPTHDHARPSHGDALRTRPSDGTAQLVSRAVSSQTLELFHAKCGIAAMSGEYYQILEVLLRLQARLKKSNMIGSVLSRVTLHSGPNL